MRSTNFDISRQPSHGWGITTEAATRLGLKVLQEPHANFQARVGKLSQGACGTVIPTNDQGTLVGRFRTQVPNVLPSAWAT